MKIEGKRIFADEGKGLRRRDSSDGQVVTRVSLADGDSPSNWEDCDLPVPGDEVTEADKDAALRSFGVEV